MQGAFYWNAGLTMWKEGGKEILSRKVSLGAFCPNLKFLAWPVGSAPAKFAHWRNLGLGRKILVLQCTSHWHGEAWLAVSSSTRSKRVEAGACQSATLPLQALLQGDLSRHLHGCFQVSWEECIRHTSEEFSVNVRYYTVIIIIVIKWRKL